MEIYRDENDLQAKRINLAKSEINKIGDRYLIPVTVYIVISFFSMPLVLGLSAIGIFLKQLIKNTLIITRFVPALYYIAIGTLIKITAKKICALIDNEDSEEDIKSLIKRQKILCVLLIFTLLVFDICLFIQFKDILYVVVGSYIIGFASIYEAILGIIGLFATIKAEKLLFDTDYQIEKVKKPVTIKRQKLMTGFAYTLASLTVIGVFIFVYSFNHGNPIIEYRVKKDAKNYISENYPQYKDTCYIDSVGYWSQDSNHPKYHVVFRDKTTFDGYWSNEVAFTIVYSKDGEFLGHDIEDDYPTLDDMVIDYTNRYSKIVSDAFYNKYSTSNINSNEYPFKDRGYQTMANFDEDNSDLSQTVKFYPVFNQDYFDSLSKDIGKVTVNMWNGEFTADQIYDSILAQRDVLDKNNISYHILGGTYSEKFASMNLDKLVSVNFTYEELHSDNFKEIFDREYNDFKNLIDNIKNGNGV